MSSLIVHGENIAELGWRPSLSRLALAEPLARLSAGLGRSMLEKDALRLWWERVSAAGINAKDWHAAADWFLEFGQGWPTLPKAIQQAKACREERIRVEKDRVRRIESEQAATSGRETGDTHRERERQALKKQLGLGEYRSQAHRSRYGKEIEVTESYVPPSLRKLMDDTEDEKRGGPRRMI